MILHIDFWDSLDPNIFFLGLDSPDKKRLSGLEKNRFKQNYKNIT